MSEAHRTEERVMGANDTAYPTGHELYGGFTKRERFAMAAMQSLLTPISGDDDPQLWSYTEIATCACKAADALLKELAK